jgi:hypothetical protein
LLFVNIRKIFILSLGPWSSFILSPFEVDRFEPELMLKYIFNKLGEVSSVWVNDKGLLESIVVIVF